MEKNAIDSIYKEVILDHHKDPRNYGALEGADVSAEGYNPVCGDRILLQLKLTPDRHQISQCRFKGEGCSICLASASIMTEEIQGSSLENAKNQIENFRQLMQGTRSPEEFEGDVEALAGVRNFPVRIKCALLAWTSLKDAIEKVDEAKQ